MAFQLNQLYYFEAGLPVWKQSLFLSAILSDVASGADITQFIFNY